MFSSIEDVIERFAETEIYRQPPDRDRDLSGERAQEADPGRRAGRRRQDRPRQGAGARRSATSLIRLQCYEGLDEGKALYEWEYAKQLLYTQILKDKISEVLVGRARAWPRPSIGSPRRTRSSSPSASCCRARCSRRSTSEKPVGAADRRDRQGRRRVRGLPARAAVGFPGHGARDRHAQGQADSAGRADLEQRARNVRRAQASMPASVHRFSRARRRNSRSSSSRCPRRPTSSPTKS